MRSHQQAPRRRRSAAEWTRLVAESRESGLSLVDFAASRGVPVQRLRWWRWHLGVATRLPAAPADKLRLVPVDVEPAQVSTASYSSTPAWELCTAGGDVLRVYRAVDSAEIEAALSVMLPRRGRR
jgi:hypothetical protein